MKATLRCFSFFLTSMKIIEVKKRELNYADYIKRTALESDYQELITEDVCLMENGEKKVIYKELQGIDTSAVVEACKGIKYHEGTRSRGLKSRSRIFGYRPRMTIRADYCSSTSLALEHPEQHALVCGLGKALSDEYLKEAADTYEAHQKVLQEKTKEDWRIPGTVFTSGIINKNNPLKYHFDTGNFKDVFSVMVVFKSGVKGGHLALPEYGLGLELKHNSVLMFDGQGILHGVTPIEYASPLSFRYSIVYYSLRGIWQCLTVDDEIARIRNKKTEREKKRHPEHPDYEKNREALRARKEKQ